MLVKAGQDAAFRKTKEAIEPATMDVCPGTTATAYLSPSATSHPPRPRQTTTGNSQVRLPRWGFDLTQRASAIPGAVQ